MRVATQVRRSTSSNSILTANSISKSFAGVQALKRVSLELLEGEVHAVIGENGAGIHFNQNNYWLDCC